jgi:regulator of replication initiation timing
MTITTKEAERFARWCDTDGFTERATALRSLAVERDALRAENARLREALRAEVERLKAGGCARGQSTTQFCAEAVALQAENARLRGLLEEIGNLAESRSNRVDDLGFENARLREALLRWIAADDEGDGHECIHALADARKLVGETQ